ncbi:hypothetical protein [Parendozoicomonas haliclonae]|uniref:Methyltransferase type 11 domain-containing protein n=1 Tax=Parendozoicomonas haliclonae TaxID=1960125 RepID=A0A1X7ALW4_9GAMM|nr:hypothetical protein [Parendozoicomonas haliclonae]SMA49134.1 hypothetical protein EHSB41UT_03076 [Parendozoicomonas haliclonae]
MFARKKRPVYCLKDSLPEARTWFESERGQYLLEAEKRVLHELLPRMFGHHASTLGVHPDASLLDHTHIVYKTFLTPLQEPAGPGSVCISPNEWGIQPRSMNMVLLHHALDFAGRPHRVLREACRAILPGGKLVVVGFNPRSLWNPARMLDRRAEGIMGRARFYQPRRIKDWLTLLNFRTTELRYGDGLFPVTCHLNPERLKTVESFVAATRLEMGAFYVLVAVKERSGLIPYDRRWRSTGNRLLGTTACRTGNMMNKSDGR